MSEHDEQCAVINWADSHIEQAPPLEWIYSVPNGIPIPGKPSTRSRIINHMKAEGLKPGISDLCLPAARRDYHGLYIEMKKSGGKIKDVSEGQNEFLAYLETEGYLGVVCFGAVDAIDQLKWYLEIDECSCVACQIAKGS